MATNHLPQNVIAATTVIDVTRHAVTTALDSIIHATLAVVRVTWVVLQATKAIYARKVSWNTMNDLLDLSPSTPLSSRQKHMLLSFLLSFYCLYWAMSRSVRRPFAICRVKICCFVRVRVLSSVEQGPF